MSWTEGCEPWLDRAGRRSYQTTGRGSAALQGRSFATCSTGWSPFFQTEQKEDQKFKKKYSFITKNIEILVRVVPSPWESFQKEGTVWVQLKQTPCSKAKRQMLQTSEETLRCSAHHYMCHIIWQGVDRDSSTLRGPAHPPQRRFVASVTSMWLWGHAVQVTCEENGTSVSFFKKLV